MRVPRFRLRTLMIVVAIVGGVFALVIESRRLSQVSLVHLKRAESIRLEEEYWASNAERYEALLRAVETQYEAVAVTDAARKKLLGTTVTALRNELQADMAMTDRSVTHFKTLRLKYERAARYPWLSVPPDPPPPN